MRGSAGRRASWLPTACALCSWSRRPLVERCWPARCKSAAGARASASARSTESVRCAARGCRPWHCPPTMIASFIVQSAVCGYMFSFVDLGHAVHQAHRVQSRPASEAVRGPALPRAADLRIHPRLVLRALEGEHAAPVGTAVRVPYRRVLVVWVVTEAPRRDRRSSPWRRGPASSRIPSPPARRRNAGVPPSLWLLHRVLGGEDAGQRARHQAPSAGRCGPPPKDVAPASAAVGHRLLRSARHRVILGVRADDRATVAPRRAERCRHPA